MNYNKLIAWVLAPVFGAVGLWLWSWLGKVNAMAENQESYEKAYIQTTEFVREQRVANELIRHEQQRQNDEIEQNKEYMRLLIERLISEGTS